MKNSPKSSLRADFGYWGGEERKKLSFLSSPATKVCAQATKIQRTGDLRFPHREEFSAWLWRASFYVAYIAEIIR